jgi:SepF-like predicted cell division protein (DUF552 family)
MRGAEGIGMTFIKKPFKKSAEGAIAAEAGSYIDLGELALEEEGIALGEPIEHLVKVAEIYRYEDAGDLTTHVYNGSLLLLDFTTIANDELAVKRVTNEFKQCARDCGGDVAVVAKNFLLATPSGIKIDRNKIKGTY